MSTLRLHRGVSLLVLPLLMGAGARTAEAKKVKTDYFATPTLESLKPSDQLTLLPLRAYQQVEDYTCGPASAMTILRYYGLIDDRSLTHDYELSVAKQMGSTVAAGTSTEQLESWLKGRGLLVERGKDGTLSLIQSKLKQGLPLLVNWIDWGGHWAIVIGYDTLGTDSKDDDVLIFADPSDYADDRRDGVTFFNAERFQYMWFGYQSLTENKPKAVWIAAGKPSEHKD